MSYLYACVGVIAGFAASACIISTYHAWHDWRVARKIQKREKREWQK